MLNRRTALGLIAATAIAPARSFAEESRPKVDPVLGKRFIDDGTAGVFVALKSANELIVSDATRAAAQILPASTFKIPNSLIALETGVVADPDKDVFKWDGVVRNFPDWNKDHTLRSAIAASAVPVYQEIARRIGRERMSRFVKMLDYGNCDIGDGPIDYFWLNGALRIAPMEQVAFIDRLRRRQLPVSVRAQDAVCDILPVVKVGQSVIRSKSGLIGVDDASPAGGVSASVGWLVGWAERGGVDTPFALNLDIREPRHIASRMKLSQQLLADIGAT